MYFAELVFLRLICPIRKIKTQPNQTRSRRHFLGQKPFFVFRKMIQQLLLKIQISESRLCSYLRRRTMDKKFCSFYVCTKIFLKKVQRLYVVFSTKIIRTITVTYNACIVVVFFKKVCTKISLYFFLKINLLLVTYKYCAVRF
jgi:hypothetical protein